MQKTLAQSRKRERERNNVNKNGIGNKHIDSNNKTQKQECKKQKIKKKKREERERKMALLHCLTRSHISFMMQVSDGDSRYKPQQKRFILFLGCFAKRPSVSEVVFFLLQRVCVFIDRSLDCLLWHRDIVRQQRCTGKTLFRPLCLCRHQCSTDFLHTYHRLFGGLSSFQWLSNASWKLNMWLRAKSPMYSMENCSKCLLATFISVACNWTVTLAM